MMKIMRLIMMAGDDHEVVVDHDGDDCYHQYNVVYTCDVRCCNSGVLL